VQQRPDPLLHQAYGLDLFSARQIRVAGQQVDAARALDEGDERYRIGIGSLLGLSDRISVPLPHLFRVQLQKPLQLASDFVHNQLGEIAGQIRRFGAKSHQYALQ